MFRSVPPGFRIGGVLIAIALAALLAGCASTTTYVRPDTVTKTMDFSDTDLRMNAEAMVNSLLQARFLQNLSDAPLLAMSGIENRTSEHIDTRSIENTIETQLLKSGVFQVVDRSVLQKAAQEKALVGMKRIDVADAVRLGDVVGADYFLIGELSGIDTAQGSRAVGYKKLTMKLVDVDSTVVVWADEKEIKKATR